MEQEYFRTNSEFSGKICKGLVQEAYQAAKRRIESQMESERHITHVSATFLGWLVAGLMPLAGIVVTLAPRGYSIALVMASYGFFALLLPAVALLFGLHVGQSFHMPGCRPRAFFTKEVVDWVNRTPKSEQEIQVILARLQTLQWTSDENEKIHGRQIRAYRRAVYVLCAELLLGVVLFLALLLN